MNYLIKQKELEILEIELKIRKLEWDILKDLDFEMLLPIEGYDNYFISNFGNVKNNKTNRIMKQCNHRKGYKVINFSKNGIIKQFRVHRLVALAFLENLDNKPNVDHIDNNTSNNNVKNLRWATDKKKLANQGKREKNTSGYKGVFFHKKAKKYRTLITINGKLKHIGLFETAEKALEAYEAKAKAIHGEFYYKNK